MAQKNTAVKKKPKSIAPINPREPLTRKARAAIDLYVNLKAEKSGMRYQGFMIGYVLEAERMKRQQLYVYLESRGYRWDPPYWTIRDVDGRLVGGYCPPERRPK